MPIKPENRARYPSDWAAISKRVRKEAGNVCEWCGVKNRAWIARLEANPMRFAYSYKGFQGGNGYRKARQVTLTVAHMNHTPEDNRPSNLRALCNRCHLSYDMRCALRAKEKTKRFVRRQRARQSDIKRLRDIQERARKSQLLLFG